MWHFVNYLVIQGEEEVAYLSQGFDPFTNQKFPFLVFFMTSFFGRTTHKFFLRCQYIIILKGSAHQKKTQFIRHHFPKQNKKRHFWSVFFFKSLPAAQETWSKLGQYNEVEELRKLFSKKRSTKLAKNLKIHPFREKPSFAPFSDMVNNREFTPLRDYFKGKIYTNLGNRNELSPFQKRKE